MAKANPRQIAMDILSRVDRGAYAEPLIDHALTHEPFDNAADRRLLTQLVYGTLRMRGRLDWFLKNLYHGRLEKMEPRLKNLIRTGLYQLLLMDRIPDHAAVDESVRIAKRLFPGREGLVNAVLRKAVGSSGEVQFPELETEPVNHIAAFHSHPLWLVEQWINRYGMEETIELCRANNENAVLCLRVNRLKASREDVLSKLSQEGFDIKKTVFSPDGLHVVHAPHTIRECSSFQEGWIQMQDEASQLIAPLLDPQPGETILDLCSGIGGKATHSATLMKNTGQVLALDLDAGKLRGLKELARHLGISTIQTMAGDATKDLGSDYREHFDRILIDAPCSGLGTLRRNPEIKWRLKPEDLRTFSHLQQRMLDKARHYVKRGGILVYTTCSIMSEENEEVVQKFLSLHPDFQPVGISNPAVQPFIDDALFFRTSPRKNGMDGFFAVRLQKIAP